MGVGDILDAVVSVNKDRNERNAGSYDTLDTMGHAFVFFLTAPDPSLGYAYPLVFLHVQYLYVWPYKCQSP